MQPIFDGHNDTLFRLWLARDFEGQRFLAGDGEGHIDLPRARAGGLSGGFFAVYVPGEIEPDVIGDGDDGGIVDEPPIGPVDAAYARRVTLEMASILIRMTRARPDAIRLCLNADDIKAAEEAGAIAALFHIEGAEAIGSDLAELDMFYAAGLRSLGPVWSRPNIFGTGVPFRFPASPDQGAGMTMEGKALVRRCNDLGILVDLSHMNEAGFWEIAAITSAPLVATHSNVHALSASSRNLTRKQLEAVAESGGVVGLNYAVGFLREDGRRHSDTPLTVMLRHLDDMLDILGEGGVALGSDFDGALIPAEIGDVSGLPALVGAMRQAGYGEALIGKICHDNWVDVLRRTIG